MKKVFLMATMVMMVMGLFAQDEAKKEENPEAWKLKGVTGLNASQTALSNWSAGGENSIAGTLYLNGELSKKTGNWLWLNTLALEYGLTNTKSLGTQKVSDKIDFSTQLGYSINNKWYYTMMGSFVSQFYKGYNYPDKSEYISNFMAPGYSNVSLGIEYRPNDNYSAYLSPIAGKLTFVCDDRLSSEGAFGVDPGDKFRAELGAYLKLRAKKTLMQNVELISTADFFTAYDKSFGNVDINWDVLINMKINKFLSANINTTLKYDDDTKYISKDGTKKGARVQFKETIGLGLAYNF